MYVNRVWGNTIIKINQNVQKIFWIMLKMWPRGYLINVISFVNFYVERNLQKMLCEDRSFMKGYSAPSNCSAIKIEKCLERSIFWLMLLTSKFTNKNQLTRVFQILWI